MAMRLSVRLAVVSVFVSLFFSMTSKAATFAYTGTVSFSDHTGISVGTPFSGQVSYADDLPINLVDEQYGTFYVPVNISLSILGQDINFVSGFSRVSNDEAVSTLRDVVVYGDNLTTPIIAGEELYLIALGFSDQNGDTIHDESLVTSLDTLNDFYFKGLELYFSDAGGFPEVYGSFDIAPVPIPAAAWLFGSGLLGLIGIARIKKS